ncbi:MAG: ATP-binding cassette domain-containing protein [Deltaproteobacteria bacterium]|nr:MAG: ATP-binding cassette domain-containing protein [Deltaproteobacteria bacterium]
MLKIENVNIKKDDRIILREIDFKVSSQEIYGILGPNGAGKSSLAYAIMGCNGYRPNEGKIIFDGKVINSLPIWERARLGITLAWQQEARFEGITVEDYLLLGTKGADRADVEGALQNVLLDPKDYLKRKVDKTLSGGERKRIELAAIFTMKPRLAILDEPDSGIDILALDRIIEFVCNLRDGGSTVILITHRADVARIAERAALIGEGSLVKEGPCQEVVEYFENRCLVCPQFR